MTYQGVIIHDRAENLSLTDMWRAAGADAQRAPAKWRSLPGTKTFVDHVAFTIGKSDSELFQVVNGRNNPGTWAHWQVAMAYAKYLSPEFHMWCNTVVRDRMEGRLVPQHMAGSLLSQENRSIIGGVANPNKSCTRVGV
jgi:hypothetical protein